VRTLSTFTLRTPPENFEGRLSDFIEDFVVPGLPKADRLAAWTEAILAYYAGPNPICIVRGSKKGDLKNVGSERVVEGDNAPGIWCFLRALDGAFDPGQLETAMEAGAIPLLAMIGREARQNWNYSLRQLPARDSAALWNRKLKHCHILALDSRQGLTFRQRAMRNLNPSNHFLFPNGNKHFVTERVGWTEDPMVSDLGESSRVIEWVAWRIRESLSPVGRRLHDQFVAAAGSHRPLVPPKDGVIRIGERTMPHRDATGMPLNRNRNEASENAAEAFAARYDYSRLAFKADVIELLGMNDTFCVDTPHGSYAMTKREFYEAFPLIPLSGSYRNDRLYSYRKPPQRAQQFRIHPDKS
jgi:hypothetical protein